MTVCVFIILVELIFVDDVSIGATFYAKFKRLPPLFNIQEEYIRFVNRIETGQFKILESFIVLNAACIAEWVKAVNYANWISIDEGEYSYRNLKLYHP